MTTKLGKRATDANCYNIASSRTQQNLQRDSRRATQLELACQAHSCGLLKPQLSDRIGSRRIAAQRNATQRDFKLQRIARIGSDQIGFDGSGRRSEIIRIGLRAACLALCLGVRLRLSGRTWPPLCSAVGVAVAGQPHYAPPPPPPGRPKSGGRLRAYANGVEICRSASPKPCFEQIVCLATRPVAAGNPLAGCTINILARRIGSHRIGLVRLSSVRFGSVRSGSDRMCVLSFARPPA